MGSDLLARKKILLAPHEIGNQMQLLAEELRHRGFFATAATFSQEWYGYTNDIHLNLNHIPGKLRRHIRLLLFSLWATSNYDIFHFFWGESLYGFGPFSHLDLPILRRLGKKIFVHFRGLDLVDLKHFDYLRAKNAGEAVQEPPISRRDQLSSLQQWRKYSHRMLVSEPDLLRVAPEAVLIQQALRTEEWLPARKTSRTNNLIRIAHAPTLRRKKGTEFVMAAVDQLKEKGLPVELVLLENVPAEKMKSLYESCDIVIDQVLYGWYGKVSIEAMALGLPAVCFIDPQWFPYRPDMPIVNADPSSLVEKLAGLVGDSSLRTRIGQAGIEYVHKHHDIKRIVDQCLDIYLDSFQA